MARVVTSPHMRDKVARKTSRTNTVHDRSQAHNAFPQTKQSVLETFTPTGQYTDIATDDHEIVTALKLIASSVAEQRQLAAKDLIFHPTSLALMMIALAWSAKTVFQDPSNWLYTIVTCAVVVSTVLSFAKRFLDGYIDEAERVGTLSWLYGHDPSREHDTSEPTEPSEPAFNAEDGLTIVLVHRFKRRIVGALVMSIVRCETEPHSPMITSIPIGEDCSVFIRGWTVQREFRGYGIGAELLNEAVRICQEKRWQAPQFASRHANSVRVLCPVFHGNMDHAFAMWSSYLRKRIEAQRQARGEIAGSALEAFWNTTDDQDPMIDAKVLFTRMKGKLDALLRQSLNSNLERAREAQSRWKDML